MSVEILRAPKGGAKMSSLASDYTSNTVLIYDIYGKHIGSTHVTDHNKEEKQISVAVMPSVLKVNDDCKVMIISSPAPCEFNGKIKKIGGSLFIAMFQGQERESRSARRYPTSNPAVITGLVVDGKLHPIQTPMKVTLINISTTGVRFRAPINSFEFRDEFQMHLMIGNSQKKITARVMNFIDEFDTSTYGCMFLVIE